MDFRILGPLEVLSDGRALDLGGRKQRTLLALLLLEANKVVSRDRLIDGLWEEEPPKTAQKALQVYVSQLRKLLGNERVQTKAPGYLLHVDPDALDLSRFQRLHEEGRLQEALSLWRGPPLTDLAEQRFAQPEIARLAELRLVCLEARIEQDLAAGRSAELVGELEALVKQHPLREGLRAQLMLGLYCSGRQAEALDAYQATRAAYVDELGIEPGRRLRELHQAMLRQDPGLDLAAAAKAVEKPRGAFVGRGTELAYLVGGLDDAVDGRGRLFLLAGEPGIGKSRLADELIAHASARGVRVLVGRCWEAGGAPAYWPWVQSLRAYVRDIDAATLRAQLGSGGAELAQILPELHQHLPDLNEPRSLESESARFRLFDATAGFLRSASENRPVLLVLDDLHAADTPSLLLLRFIARELGSVRMMLLGAYRDVDPIPGHPLTEMLAEASREPVTRRIALGGLSERDVAAYVEATAAKLASPALIAAVHEEAAGNPLFVGEIVRLLCVEGLRPETTAEVQLAIPQSVRYVIARRLTHLADECNRVLVLASVLGREFGLEALARVSAVSVDDLLETLDEAMAARILSDAPAATGHLRFEHVLIRDTLYEGLTPARRARLHRLAVDALEALYGDEPGQHLAELAHHAIAGRDFEKSLRYARRAGDRSLTLLAYEEAARLYATALDALDLSAVADERTRCELLLALGEAQARAGNMPLAKTAFLDAAEIARRLGLARALALAAAGYGGRIVWVRAEDDDRLVALLEEGLAALPEDEVELRARLLARLSGALRDEHSRDRRDRMSREALELARQTGNSAALAYALAGRAHSITAPDTVAALLALGSELRDVAERSGDRERMLAGHSLRIMAQLMAGDIRGAEADLEALSRIADELRQPAQLWEVRSTGAMLALAKGRLGDAEKLIPQAFALGERALPQGAITHHGLHRYTLCDFRGCLEEVEPTIRDLVADYPARPVFRCVLAHLHARLGRRPEAKGALDDLTREDCSALPFDQEWLYGMSLLAETSALVDDSAAGSVLYRLLVPWETLSAVDVGEGFRGSVSRYLGILATMTGRLDEAERHFEEGLARNADMGVLPWLAYTQSDYARMLLARGGAGDAAHAQGLRHAALSTYGELGMSGSADAAVSMSPI